MNKIKKITICVIITIIIISIFFIFQSYNTYEKDYENISLETANIPISDEEMEAIQNNIEKESKLTNKTEINLHDIDGKGKNYEFTYKNETYKATYRTDNWHITNSYKITNHNDISIICEALIEIHQIHGKDMKSYRTVDDLVYEWEQHNLAYMLLPEGNVWKSHAKDVDLNPADQGRSLKSMLEARTGKNYSIKNIFSKKTLKKIKNKILNKLLN